MNPKQLKEIIIKPALEAIAAYSPAALSLVFGTACVESNCGEAIRQEPSGPALGIFQMELDTHQDIFENYLSYNPILREKVLKLFCPGMTVEQNICCNLMYAAAMCRIHYLRFPGEIPQSIEGQAEYWKKYYNTSKGKGSVAGFIKAYRNVK